MSSTILQQRIPYIIFSLVSSIAGLFTFPKNHCGKLFGDDKGLKMVLSDGSNLKDQEIDDKLDNDR